jgi:hypothetical protein
MAATHIPMTRRQLLQALAALTLSHVSAAPRARADVPPAPFIFWVERFYRAQLAARLMREGRATAANQQGADPSLSGSLRVHLTPEMQTLFDAAREKPLPTDTPDGPILDYVLGWGALPNREIKLISVQPASWWQSLATRDLALVTLSINGNERVLTLTGEYSAETFTWKIADIDYGDGAGETLRERLGAAG